MSLDFLGNEPALSLLGRAVAAGRLPHAMLVHGPDGVGKTLLAQRLVATLLCGERSASEPDPCFRCPECTRVLSGNHPDQFWIRRLPKREAAARDNDLVATENAASGDLRPFITVDQIRALSEHAAYAPREGRARVFVIDPADRMNPPAQNALLKTLEEPPPRTFLVLVAARPHVLLPTVRSRCFLVGLSPMEAGALARALENRGLPPSEAKLRASLGGGRPGMALTVDLSAEAARRDEILGMVERLAGSPAHLVEMPAMAKALVGDGEETLLNGLEQLETILRETFRSAVGVGSLTATEQEDRIDAIARTLGAQRASEILEGVETVRSGLRFHLNRSLAAEAIFASLAGGPTPRR